MIGVPIATRTTLSANKMAKIDMRTLIQATFFRDRKGYEVRINDERQPIASAAKRSLPPTILSGGARGPRIVGRSGVNDTHTISTADNHRLWEKVIKLDSPDDVAKFMGKWGKIDRWLGEDSTQAHDEPFSLIKPKLDGIKYLAAFVDSGDRESFAWSLRQQILAQRVDIKLDIKEPYYPLVIDAKSLYRFILFEMWSEFGSARSANLGIRTCEYCSKTFNIDGRRGGRGRRADARYCSDSCKNMASRARVAARRMTVAE